MDSSDSGTAAAATPFLCMYGCSYPFPRKGERDRHIDEKHHARKKCPHCSFSSPRRQRLKEHLEGKHGIRSRKVRKVKSVTINSKPRSLRKATDSIPRHREASRWSHSSSTIAASHISLWPTSDQPVSPPIPYNDTDMYSCLPSVVPHTYLGDGRWICDTFTGSPSGDCWQGYGTVNALEPQTTWPSLTPSPLPYVGNPANFPSDDPQNVVHLPYHNPESIPTARPYDTFLAPFPHQPLGATTQVSPQHSAYLMNEGFQTTWNDSGDMLGNGQPHLNNQPSGMAERALSAANVEQRPSDESWMAPQETPKEWP